MSNCQIISTYTVHTQVIALDDRPFAATKGKIRPVWQPLFEDKSCFTDFSTLIMPYRRSPPPEKPFLRRLGSICFNPRSLRFATSWEKGALTDYLRRRRRIDKHPKHYYQQPISVFGYDQELEDERMNYLYFELYKPIFLRAKTEDDTRAEGKIFIHFYPSGYIVLQIVVALTWRGLRNVESLRQILKETRPWRPNSNWLWSSRIGSGKLHEIVDIIRSNLNKSLYVDYSITLRQSIWQSAVKVFSNAKENDIATEGERIAFGLLLPRGKPEGLGIPCSNWFTYLLASRQGLACIFIPSASRVLGLSMGCQEDLWNWPGLWKWPKRKRALRFFWKILLLDEFVALKRQIYQDYAELLRNEVGQLKDFRLSLKRKATQEDLLRFSVYDYEIPQFLSALDKHIRSAPPFYRRIYSTISTGTGFDEQRGKVKNLVRQWEEEITLWKHPLRVAWEKIISPVRSMLVSNE